MADLFGPGFESLQLHMRGMVAISLLSGIIIPGLYLTYAHLSS